MTVEAYHVERHFFVSFNGKPYDVIRTEASYSDWEPKWAVYSTGGTGRRFCNPDRPTHKRVVAYVKSTAGILETPKPPRYVVRTAKEYGQWEIRDTFNDCPARGPFPTSNYDKMAVVALAMNEVL